ncbi:hypothetical protein [Actinomadura oligospora]|uniref:hypothetical protein n=1 Tax=Actinomadura oligospora TaxID=111804 RepID=UPI0004BC7631|nr:hypothetical protein [Actinomadura oligospora]
MDTSVQECVGGLGGIGLVSCAADFAIDPRGEWFFLGDLNPNGEWGWLAHHCDLPIAASIADVLEGVER